MNMENIIKNACYQSINRTRTGDTEEEIKFIQKYLKSSKKIIIPTENLGKVKSINKVLRRMGLSEGEQLPINTNIADLSRLPAISKAIMAIDQCQCDVVIARGRLGVPGSGSLLVITDNLGRILTGATSPPHVVHGKDLRIVVAEETQEALEKIGLQIIY
ncbi:MAG TPA: FeGP cofactor biosynthesis guanylyltransferase HcgB family protein [Methanobacterium sp.]|nr:FeGP cofactor biosynthesis guanylyltransferase HcgB family protein [Methanobacterium sp.]